VYPRDFLHHLSAEKEESYVNNTKKGNEKEKGIG